MLYAVTTGAYYPPVDTTLKILTTAGALCIAPHSHILEPAGSFHA